MSILELSDVTFSYYGELGGNVLNGVNAVFEPGVLYVVRGTGGSGKTTLLSIIAGVAKALYGGVYFDGQNINTFDGCAYRALTIGAIFQGFNLNERYTVLENLRLTIDIGKPHRQAKMKAFDDNNRIAALIKCLPLDKKVINKRISALTAEDRAYAALARALCNDPPVVFADEPAWNFSRESEIKMAGIFRALAKDGKCVIVATRTSGELFEADCIYELADGKLTKN